MSCVRGLAAFPVASRLHVAIFRQLAITVHPKHIVCLCSIVENCDVLNFRILMYGTCTRVCSQPSHWFTSRKQAVPRLQPICDNGGIQFDLPPRWAWLLHKPHSSRIFPQRTKQ